MKDYLEETIESYDENAKAYETTRAALANPKRIEYFLSVLPGKEILEVGCGPGRDARLFVDAGCTVTGIDLSDGLLSIAKEKVPQARFLRMDVTDLDFDEATFDGIWASAVLLHLRPADALQALRECFRILRPGGSMRASVKKGDGPAQVGDHLHAVTERFFYFYQSEEFRSLFETAGFAIHDAQESVRNYGISTLSLDWIDIIATKPV